MATLNRFGVLEDLQEKVNKGQNFSDSEKAVVSSAINYNDAVKDTDSLIDQHFARKLQISQHRENLAFEETQRRAADVHNENQSKAVGDMMNSSLAKGLLALGIVIIL